MRQNKPSPENATPRIIVSRSAFSVPSNRFFTYASGRKSKIHANYRQYVLKNARCASSRIGRNENDPILNDKILKMGVSIPFYILMGRPFPTPWVKGRASISSLGDMEVILDDYMISLIDKLNSVCVLMFLFLSLFGQISPPIISFQANRC